MRKKIVLVAVLLGVFYFRGEIAQSYRQIFGSEKVQAFGWLSDGYKEIDLAIESADIDTSLELLGGLQNKVEHEIEKPSLPFDDENKRHNYKRRLICELAGIYRKMAMQFLQKGDEMAYVRYMELSNEEVTECATLNGVAKSQ